MKRYRKYFFQSLSAIALGLMLMGSEEVPVFAQRQPVFTNDFGGTRISCSVYRKQVALMVCMLVNPWKRYVRP